MTAVAQVQFFNSVYCFVEIPIPFCFAYNRTWYFDNTEIQSCPCGWCIRESTQLSLTYLGAIILLYYLLKPKIFRESAYSVLIPQSRNACTILRATDPLAYCFCSCLRSCSTTYVLSRNVMKKQAFASCCVVCADLLLKQSKPRALR